MASARDNSDWDVWVSKADLRLQCGMPCSKLEVSTVQHGTLSGAGYLHQSQAAHAVRVDRQRTHPAPSGPSERSVSPKSPEFPRPNPLALLRPKTRRVSART